MRRYFPVLLSSRRRSDQVLKWFCWGNASQATRLPFPQIVLHSSFAGFAEKTPRFPTGFRHNGHIREFIMGILGSIPTSQGKNRADYLCSLLKFSLDKAFIDKIRDQRVGCNKDMSSRNQ